MNKISKFFSSVIFRRILVIFVVGLVSRSLVNGLFEVNVFKEYSTNISLCYYMFMALFSGLVHESSLNFINLNWVKSFIKLCCESNHLFKSEMTMDGFTDNMRIKEYNLKHHTLLHKRNSSIDTWENSGVLESRSTLTPKEKGSSNSAAISGLYGNTEFRPKPSAGLRGLYSNNGESVGRQRGNTRFTRECRSFYTWIKEGVRKLIGKN